MKTIIPIKTLTSTSEGDYIINLYLQSLRSKNTRRVYKRSIDSFFNFFYGDKPITLKDMIIDTYQAQEYINHYNHLFVTRKIKSSTFNSYIKGIKSFYKWLMIQTTLNTKDLCLLKINPMANAKLIKEFDSEGSDFLTPEEVELMLNNPIGANKHLQIRNTLMLELALITGLRCEAVCSLTIDDIKPNGKDICVHILDKGNKLFIKPINSIYDRLSAWLKIDLSSRKDDSRSVFNIKKEYANQIITDWAKKLKINKKITFHSLRITCAIEIYQSTNDIYKVQKFLGHSSTKITTVYLSKKEKILHDGETIMTNRDDIIKKLKDKSKDELIDMILEMKGLK